MTQGITALHNTREFSAPQLQKLAAWLQDHGSVSALEAQLHLAIHALPRRIADLQESGVRFVKKRRKDKRGSPYVRYFVDGHEALRKDDAQSLAKLAKEGQS